MTPNEQSNITGVTPPVRGGLGGARAASTICLLAGIWFFISPWVYGSYVHAVAVNNWVVGALTILFAAIRLARPAYATGLSWANMVLGIWIFCSPWIYGYAGADARFTNSIVVGIVLFVCSLISLWVSAPRIPRSTGTPLPRT